MDQDSVVEGVEGVQPLGLGDTVTFKMGKTERTLPISGLIRHPFVPPPQFQDLMFFFMDGEGVERMGVPAGKFNNWSLELDEILANVRERFEAAPMTEAEISAEVKEARTEYYAHRRS